MHQSDGEPDSFVPPDWGGWAVPAATNPPDWSGNWGAPVPATNPPDWSGNWGAPVPATNSPDWSGNWGAPVPATNSPDWSGNWGAPVPAPAPTPDPALVLFETPSQHKVLPKVHVFVDEYGDRNFKNNRESEWFTMTALMVEQEHVDHMRAAVAGLRSVYRIPAGNKLHWVDHFKVKQEARRFTALHLLTSIPNIRLVNVLLHKPSVGLGAHMRNEQARSYHLMTQYLMERVARAAAGWPGGPRLAKVSLGVVGGVDHDETMMQLHAAALRNDARTPFGNLLWPFKWFDSARLDGLQAADVFSGFLTAALVSGDGRYYSRVLQLVCTDPRGNHLGEGMKIFPNNAIRLVTESAWWRSCPGAHYWDEQGLRIVSGQN
ncbi:hypothetical protein GCM10009688_11460 [Arthrobacter gandavensis]|uniref:DUF3800 domain-containing protein n=1 Tax=Arthrobacter gandavensis TaxID=169960 RepID=A0ABN2P157_9MICC